MGNRAVSGLLAGGAVAASPASASAHDIVGRLERSGAAGSEGGPPPPGHLIIFRYFDHYPADGGEAALKARFVAFVENALTAGISARIAEAAGSVTLAHWGGWSHPAVGDFDWGYIDGPRGFRAALEKELREAGAGNHDLGPLLKQIFAARPDQARLQELGRAAGFGQGDAGGQQELEDLNLNEQFEKEVLDFYADRFETRGEWKGQGAAFRLAWAQASDRHKRRMLDILLGSGWEADDHVTPSAHLSDLSYLVEGVNGKTPGSPGDIQYWAKHPQGSLFDYMVDKGGYKTKYMTAEERQQHALTIDGGQVRLPTHEPLVGDNIFVLGADSVFYGGAKKSGRDPTVKEDSIHHSSFMAGEPVYGAGHFITGASGDLRHVSEQSGHYAPNEYEVGVVLYLLAQFGTDLTHVTIDRKKYKNAEEFLQFWETKYMPQETTTPPSKEPSTSSENDESKTSL